MIIIYCILFHNGLFDGLIELLFVLFMISMESLTVLLIETFYFQDLTVNLEKASYIVHRMALVTLVNLFDQKQNNNNSNKNNKNNKNKNKKDSKDEIGKMLFPKLQAFFEFIWNFSVYCACYPDTHLDNAKNSEQNELFYIRQYFYFKNTTYRGRGFDCNLKDFNFFDAYFRSDGTLLHSATEYNMQYYVELLLKDKFDCQRSNRRGGTFFSSPYTIAKRRNYSSLMAKFDVALRAAKSIATSNENTGSVHKVKQLMIHILNLKVNYSLHVIF